MTLRSDHLSFPQFIRSGIADLPTLLRESKFDLSVTNSMKGAVKERVNLFQVCERRASKQLAFMLMMAKSDLEDPSEVGIAFKRLSAGQLYIDSVFDSFRDRLHLLRRRVLVVNWDLRCALVHGLDEPEFDITPLRVQLRECYRKAIVGTAPGRAKNLVKITGFQEEFNRTVTSWVRGEITDIDSQLAELR